MDRLIPTKSKVDLSLIPAQPLRINPQMSTPIHDNCAGNHKSKSLCKVGTFFAPISNVVNITREL